MNSRFTTNTTRESGFTIVELLIVIVVIGILAAITLVAFGGVRDRANTSAAQSAANEVLKKAEIYKSLEGSHPTAAQLTDSATPIEARLETGKTVSGTAPTDANGKTHTQYSTCTSPAGFSVGYRNYTSKTTTTIFGGGATSASTC